MISHVHFKVRHASTVAASVITALCILCSPDGPAAVPEPDPFIATGDIVINEVCVNNSGSLTDEDNDDPDWIELYNRGESAVSLEGYTLCDDTSDVAAAWSFGAVTMEPKTYLVVCASGKNRPLPLETPPDDTVEFIGAYGWSDSAMTGGGSTIRPFMGEDLLCRDSNGVRVVSATMNLVDNRPSFDWCAADITIRMRRQHTDAGEDFSAYKLLELTMTLEKDKNLVIRFVQNTLPNFKGAATTLKGTGVPSDRYLVPLEPGKGGLDLTCITRLRLEAPEYSFGSTSFTLHRAVFTSSAHYVHTDFKLSGKETGLFLRSAQRPDTLADAARLLPIENNLTMGRNSEGFWSILPSPTPGRDNSFFDSPLSSVTDTASIVTGGGIYAGPVRVVLKPAKGTTVHYTLDGSVPTTEHPAYSAPIKIDSTTVLRYMAVKPGAIQSAVKTETFFIGETTKLPVVSISTNPSWLFDEDTGLYMPGPNATDSYPYFGANFWSDKEVPAHCELYEPDGRRLFSIDAGLSIAGNWSRGKDKKSLEINFRELYGKKELECPIFPDYPQINRFRKIVLRNNGGSNHDAMIENPMMQSLMDIRDVDYQKMRQTAVFINGAYFGLHQLMEPANHDYVYSNYGYKKEEIDFFDFGGKLKWGTPDAWNRLEEMLRTAVGDDCEAELSDSVYALACQEMDVYNFIDYNALEIYINNTDWPYNNNRRWRPRNGDGKWRWLLYDLDGGFGGFGYIEEAAWADFNTLAFALDGTQPADEWPNGSDYTFMLRALLRNSSFYEDFINRFLTLMAYDFSAQRVEKRIVDMIDVIRDEIPADFARWDIPLESWDTSVGELIAFAQERPSYVMGFIKEQFSPGETFTLTVDAAPKSVLVNGMAIVTQPFTATYFSDVPPTLYVPQGFKQWSDGSTENPRRINSEAALSPVLE